jgi:hypothetical protein
MHNTQHKRNEEAFDFEKKKLFCILRKLKEVQSFDEIHKVKNSSIRSNNSNSTEIAF